MGQYYSNTRELEAALKKCKAQAEAAKIRQSLEQRNAPPAWINMALEAEQRLEG